MRLDPPIHHSNRHTARGPKAHSQPGDRGRRRQSLVLAPRASRPSPSPSPTPAAAELQLPDGFCIPCNVHVQIATQPAFEPPQSVAMRRAGVPRPPPQQEQQRPRRRGRRRGGGGGGGGGRGLVAAAPALYALWALVQMLLRPAEAAPGSGPRRRAAGAGAGTGAAAAAAAAAFVVPPDSRRRWGASSSSRGLSPPGHHRGPGLGLGSPARLLVGGGMGIEGGSGMEEGPIGPMASSAFQSAPAHAAPPPAIVPAIMQPAPRGLHPVAAPPSSVPPPPPPSVAAARAAASRPAQQQQQQQRPQRRKQQAGSGGGSSGGRGWGGGGVGNNLRRTLVAYTKRIRACKVS